MLRKDDCILFSGGAPGAEAAFGEEAEKHGVEEVNFTFEGHTEARQRGRRVLNHEELLAGDVSLEYVSKLMNRRYTEGPHAAEDPPDIWYQVNHGQEIYVVGHILEDGTVRGGTGWGAEFAKLCNKPLHVFDQEKDGWFAWEGGELDRAARGATDPRIHPPAHHRAPAPACSKQNGRAGDQGAVRSIVRWARVTDASADGTQVRIAGRRARCSGLAVPRARKPT